MSRARRYLGDLMHRDEEDDFVFACSYCADPVPDNRELREEYHSRRYAHYRDDFETAADLRAHLRERARHFSADKPKDVLEQEMLTVEATVGWWLQARDAKIQVEAARARAFTGNLPKLKPEISQAFEQLVGMYLRKCEREGRIPSPSVIEQIHKEFERGRRETIGALDAAR